ncbi:MSMEG_0565 family glycosyltransferase [Pseudokineococcus sp. 1T1Z-3]|uniref:MSMEG_0565 family glycosyltransferase n=1 Tax=Pseudokineococcus sp. 1T1Z-3 TaxID=3132745 RepID=UPI00403F6561
MRVALSTYSTRPRGGVVHTLALAEALARRGHDVTVWTLARGGDAGFFRPVDPAVRVVAVPFPTLDGEDVGARVVRSIDVLRRSFAERARGDDVVHAQDCISANALTRAGASVVRTIHHLDAFTTPELVACHDAAVVEPVARVCVSAAVAAEVEAGYGLRPTVIPGGVDAARFAAAAGQDPGAAAARDAWTQRLGRYVLALGGVEPRKGTLDLVEACALLRDGGGPPPTLVVAGGETLFDYRPYRAAVAARAAELGVVPVDVGTVPDERLPALVAAAGALAFPSTKEGFGMAPLEALAAGVPVVARGLPVLREVLGDAVLYGDDPPALAAALRTALDGGAPDPARGRALADRHGWEGVAAAHERLYEAVRGGARGAVVVLPGGVPAR